MTDHPITPPAILPIFDLCLSLELILTWKARYKEAGYTPEEVLKYVAWEAAQWGADQELEACCEWVDWKWSGIKNRELRATRRPKPPSLKEQALALVNSNKPYLDDTAMGIIRRALEQLNG